MNPIQYITEPNLIVPLAVSFNQRGIDGFTQALVNADDQLKINSVYEPIQNAGSGKLTLYLAKRPGVSSIPGQVGPGSFGTSTQTTFLTEVDINRSSSVLVMKNSTNSIKCAFFDGTEVAVTTSLLYFPTYIDKTSISNTELVVLQLMPGGGGGNQQIFYSDDVINNGFTQITATSSISLKGKMEFLDGYALIGTTDGRIVNSDLNSISTWPATGFIKRSATQDISRGIARLGNQIVSFGSASMQVFQNAGTPFGSPLVAVRGLEQQNGIAETETSQGTHYCTSQGGWLYWKGENPHGAFAFNGQRVEKISSIAVDKILAGTIHRYVSQLGFSGKLAIVFGLTQIGTAPHNALLYFPAWKEWFLWTSTVFTPISSPRRIDVCIGTSTTPHRLYMVTSSGSENYQDDGINYTWTHQFKLRKAGNGRQQMDMFGVMGDTATSSLSLGVQFSDDDYQTLSTTRTIDMTSHSKMITRCGGFRTQRAVKLSYTGNQPLRLESVISRIR